MAIVAETHCLLQLDKLNLDSNFMLFIFTIGLYDVFA
jgi:hypothetical protein